MDIFCRVYFILFIYLFSLSRHRS